MSITDASAAVRAVFTIPADPKTADGMAGDLGELATATEWKRAAIVYARVRVQDCRGRPAEAEKVASDLLTPAEYALLGIHGLRSKTTVRAYWRAWDNAVVEGLAQSVSLGDNVQLPEAEWADYYQSAGAATTPPYYVPPPTGSEIRSGGHPLPSSALDEFESSEGDLGLGSCPPLASSVEDGERRQRRNGGGGHRGKLPRSLALRRAGSLIANIEGLNGEDAQKQTAICDLIADLMASIELATESN